MRGVAQHFEACAYPLDLRGQCHGVGFGLRGETSSMPHASQTRRYSVLTLLVPLRRGHAGRVGSSRQRNASDGCNRRRSTTAASTRVRPCGKQRTPGTRCNSANMRRNSRGRIAHRTRASSISCCHPARSSVPCSLPKGWKPSRGHGHQLAGTLAPLASHAEDAPAEVERTQFPVLLPVLSEIVFDAVVEEPVALVE